MHDNIIRFLNFLILIITCSIILMNMLRLWNIYGRNISDYFRVYWFSIHLYFIMHMLIFSHTCLIHSHSRSTKCCILTLSLMRNDINEYFVLIRECIHSIYQYNHIINWSECDNGYINVWCYYLRHSHYW